jgi:2-polyprenyl-6-methoxyphenol hydroxylase-like FAD-dependent oxidoreductase
MLSFTHFSRFKALETIGCADKLVELGIKAESLNVWNRTAKFFTLDVSVLAQYTKYPYVLLLPQNKTEDVLEEHLKGLGIEVQRPYKAIGIKGDVDELGNTEVLFESGEVIKAQYVIGADGARSVVSNIISSFLSISSPMPFHFPDPPAFWHRVRRPRWSPRR